MNVNVRLQKRYDELTRTIRCYRNLLMLKRMGCGHDRSRIALSNGGALVLECPACPHPGINMPEDWKTQFANEP
jgi:hypothetical protein